MGNAARRRRAARGAWSSRSRTTVTTSPTVSRTRAPGTSAGMRRGARGLLGVPQTAIRFGEVLARDAHVDQRGAGMRLRPLQRFFELGLRATPQAKRTEALGNGGQVWRGD